MWQVIYMIDGPRVWYSVITVWLRLGVCRAIRKKNLICERNSKEIFLNWLKYNISWSQERFWQAFKILWESLNLIKILDSISKGYLSAQWFQLYYGHVETVSETGLFLCPHHVKCDSSVLWTSLPVRCCTKEKCKLLKLGDGWYPIGSKLLFFSTPSAPNWSQDTIVFCH